MQTVSKNPPLSFINEAFRRYDCLSIYDAVMKWI